MRVLLLSAYSFNTAPVRLEFGVVKAKPTFVGSSLWFDHDHNPYRLSLHYQQQPSLWYLDVFHQSLHLHRHRPLSATTEYVSDVSKGWVMIRPPPSTIYDHAD